MKIKIFLICFILLLNINVLAVSETEITNVKVNGESITCNNFICSATVNSEKVKIEYKLIDSEATSSGFESGEEFTFTGDTITKKLVVSKQLEGFETPISSEYTFNLTKHIMSDDYSIKKVTFNGKNITLKKDLYVYNVEVKYDVTDLKLEVVPNSTYAEVTIQTDLYFDTNDSNKAIDFTVKSELGTEKTYRLIVVRENRPDTSIKSIKLSSGVVEIERGITEYEVNVPYDVNKIDIDVETNDGNAYADIEKEDNLVVGENTIKIKVSNKELSTEYTLIVNRLDNTEEATVNLKDLEIEGYDDFSFKPGVNEYDLYFNEVPKKLKITATPVNKNNTVEIPDNRNLADGSTVHIILSQESLGLSKEYILHIHKDTVVHKFNLLLIILPIVFIISIIVIVIVVTHKKKKVYKKKENKKEVKKEKKEEKKEVKKEEKIIENDDDDFEII